MRQGCMSLRFMENFKLKNGFYLICVLIFIYKYLYGSTQMFNAKTCNNKVAF